MQTRPIAAILWMLLSGLGFVGVNVGVKYVGGDLPAVESAFVRYALGLVLLVPMVPRILRQRPTSSQWRLIGLRGGFHTAGVFLWFYAMAQIPMSEVTALNYMNPIYVTLLSGLVLGEALPFRRILTVGVAFLGALIILRPGLRELSSGHAAMMLCAVMFAGSYLTAKRLTAMFPAAIVVAFMSISVALGLAPFALWQWVTPTLPQLAVFAAVATSATVGHYAMMRAFALAPMSVTQPVVFLQLVWAVTFGALLFNEPADIWVVVGGLIIVAAITASAWREAQARRGLASANG